MEVCGLVPSWVKPGEKGKLLFSLHLSLLCAPLGGQAGSVPAGTTGSEEILGHGELPQRAQVSEELIMK